MYLCHLFLFLTNENYGIINVKKSHENYASVILCIFIITVGHGIQNKLRVSFNTSGCCCQY